MQYTANSLEEHWLPFTQNKEFKENPRLVVKSEGCYMWDQNGGKILDGSSSLFNVACGHARPEISDAVYAQLQANDYTPHFQLGHPGSFELARMVARLLPDEMNHVFFANSGSEAIDTALKIVMAYNNARGEPGRIRMVSRERAYHGVTLAAASLTGLSHAHRDFGLPLEGVLHTACPDHYRNGLPGETEQTISETIAQKGIASPETLDRAVTVALGYPKGPLGFAAHYNPARILTILEGLQRCYGHEPRYRPSPWLRRRVQLGLPLTAPDRAR